MREFQHHALRDSSIRGGCAGGRSQNPRDPLLRRSGDLPAKRISIKAFSSLPGIGQDLVGPYAELPSFATAPAVAQMNAAVNKAYPSLESNIDAWTEPGTSAWTSGLMLEAAVKAGGGQPSAAEIVKGLDSFKDQTLGGIAPPLTFTADKPHPVDCWYTAILKSGRSSVLNGGKVSCSASS